MIEKNQIPITKNALEKIITYAKGIKEIVGNYECYGFLLSPLEKNNGIIYDAMLAANQKVSGASAQISQEDAANAKAEIENLGYKALGFWHSHANFGAFHSGVDDRNLENLALDFAGNTERQIGKKFQAHYPEIRPQEVMVPINDLDLELVFKMTKMKDNVSFRSPKKGNTRHYILYDLDKKVVRVVNNEQVLHIKDSVYAFEIRSPRIEQTGSEGTAYSLTVNFNGDCYGEILRTKFCFCCDSQSQERIKNAVLRPIEIPNDIVIDKVKLVQEIRERVKNPVLKRMTFWGS